MRRPSLLAIAVLPLLAVLLMAQAVPVPPKKPAHAAPPKTAARQRVVIPPKKPAALAAQQKKTKPAAQPKKPAAPAQSKTTQAKTPEPKTHDFSDYFRMWGVSGDTTRAEIVARFGEPQRVGDWASKPFYYFNGTLTFFFTGDDTVSTMIVGNSFEPIPKDAIPADVLAKAFIGRTRDDVLKAFGPANSVSSDNYRYWPKTGVYKVEFQCYDFKRHVCEQMLVQF